jgi:hypothetical protein
MVIGASFVIATHGVAAHKMTSFVFHVVGMTAAIFIGLVGWRRGKAWTGVSVTLSSMLVAAYVFWPHLFGNLVLVMVAVGFSLVGRITRQRGFILGYIILVLFDMYAVWGSSLMNEVARNYPGPFPTFLMMGSLEHGLRNGIGAGDVLFTAIASSQIHGYMGTTRAICFAVLCTLGVLVGMLIPSQVPLLVFVSPPAIASLLIPRDSMRTE